MPGLDRGGVRADGVEGDAALQQRDQAVDVERGAARADLDREAAGVPEARALGQPQVVGGVDEGVDRHVAGVGQLDVLDAPDLDALEEHRRADRQRSAGGRPQPHPHARLVGRGQRLARQALEAVDARPGVVVPRGADVDAREHGLDAGDPLGGDARAHDPELGVGVDVAGDVLVHARGDDDLGEVGRERQPLDHADRDIAEAHRGLPAVTPAASSKTMSIVGPRRA